MAAGVGGLCWNRCRGRGREAEWDILSEGPLVSLLAWSSSLSCFHSLFRLQCWRSEKAGSWTKTDSAPIHLRRSRWREGPGPRGVLDFMDFWLHLKQGHLRCLWVSYHARASESFTRFHSSSSSSHKPTLLLPQAPSIHGVARSAREPPSPSLSKKQTSDVLGDFYSRAY